MSLRRQPLAGQDGRRRRRTLYLKGRRFGLGVPAVGALLADDVALPVAPAPQHPEDLLVGYLPPAIDAARGQLIGHTIIGSHAHPL